mgnify:CR=1 FL=1
MNLKTFVKTKVIIEKSHFYGTEIDIRAGFGPVGITEKKHIWANYEQLLRPFISKKKLKHCKGRLF